MSSSTELRNNLFIIPDMDSDNRYLVYAPLHGGAFIVDEKAKCVLDDYISGKIIQGRVPLLDSYLDTLSKARVQISEPAINFKRAVIILSQRCNLACGYCFAQFAHSNVCMTQDNLNTIIDYIFKDGDDNSISFDIIGGGEPLYEWDLCKFAISRIRSYSSSARIGITTNATLFNTDRINWLYKHSVKISVSFEILPDIQDSQRNYRNKNLSSFEIADKGIRLLLEKGFSIRIRSTITSLNVTRMQEMVDFVIEKYPRIKRLHFEPVSGQIEKEELFYSTFANEFPRIKQYASQHGIALRTSITNSIERNINRFCNGEQCFTPDLNVVSCHRVSSPRDSSFSDFCIGSISDGNVKISDIAVSKLKQETVDSYPECSSCFAKWNCAGGCLFNRKTFSMQQMKDRCVFVRQLIVNELKLKLKEV